MERRARKKVTATSRPRLVRARRTAVADDTRGALLAAARDLFLETGPARFSLREVARRVGVSAPAVYRHFANKDALLCAASTQGFERFLAYLVRALGALSPLDRLLATGEQYRLFARENPLDYRFIFMSSAEPSRHGLAPLEARAEEALPQALTFRLLVDRVQECMEAGVLAAGDSRAAALRVWAHVHGLVSLRLSGHLAPLGDDAAFAAFYEQSVTCLLRGLSAS